MILIDTHIWVWSVSNPGRLQRAHRHILNVFNVSIDYPHVQITQLLRAGTSVVRFREATETGVAGRLVIRVGTYPVALRPEFNGRR